MDKYDINVAAQNNVLFAIKPWGKYDHNSQTKHTCKNGYHKISNKKTIDAKLHTKKRKLYHWHQMHCKNKYLLIKCK